MSTMQIPPRKSIAFEQDRKRAGNKLFCPLFHPHPRMFRNLPLPYDSAARFLKVLLALGLDLHMDHNAAIHLIARVFEVAGARYLPRAHVAEYLVYQLIGIPHADGKTDKLLHTAISTFYARWVPTRAGQLFRAPKVRK